MNSDGFPKFTVRGLTAEKNGCEYTTPYGRYGGAPKAGCNLQKCRYHVSLEAAKRWVMSCFAKYACGAHSNILLRNGEECDRDS